MCILDDLQHRAAGAVDHVHCAVQPRRYDVVCAVGQVRVALVGGQLRTHQTVAAHFIVVLVQAATMSESHRRLL